MRKSGKKKKFKREGQTKKGEKGKGDLFRNFFFFFFFFFFSLLLQHTLPFLALRILHLQEKKNERERERRLPGGKNVKKKSGIKIRKII